MRKYYVSYLRVSTEKQGASGLGIDVQRSVIEQYVAQSAGKILTELTEVESGKRVDRPVLEEALRLCRQKKATLVVAKLDRLSRTVSFMSRLMETGVDFVSVDNPNANRFMVHLLAAFAEHERDLIAARTRSALKAAKERGVKLGNPKIAEAQLEAVKVLQSNADDFCSNVGPIIAQMRAAGLTSYRDIASALSTRGISSARGGQWHAASVRNVERRYLGLLGQDVATRCTRSTGLRCQ